MASTGHPPCVGLTAGLQERQQHRIVLITTVIQGLLVEVGQELHALQTVRSRMVYTTAVYGTLPVLAIWREDHTTTLDKKAQLKGSMQAHTQEKEG